MSSQALCTDTLTSDVTRSPLDSSPGPRYSHLQTKRLDTDEWPTQRHAVISLVKFNSFFSCHPLLLLQINTAPRVSDKELSQWERSHMVIGSPTFSPRSELCPGRDVCACSLLSDPCFVRKVFTCSGGRAGTQVQFSLLPVISLHEGLWILFGKTTQTKCYLLSLSVSLGKSGMSLFPWPSFCQLFGSADVFFRGAECLLCTALTDWEPGKCIWSGVEGSSATRQPHCGGLCVP